jgi:hypothetical protein
LSKSIPAHPLLLLLGHYERVAEAKARDGGRPGSFKIQKHITAELVSRQAAELLLESEPEPALAARTLSNKHRGASAWLRVVPVNRKLRLCPSEFRQSVRNYCGLLPPGLAPASRCKCGEALVLPHALSCKKLAHRFKRHDAILEDVFHWLRARRVSARKEVVGLVAGNERVDLWVYNGGTTYWCDVTVVEPANPSYLAASAVREGSAALSAVSKKRSKWSRLKPAGVVDVPLAMESTGRMAEGFEEFLCSMEEESSYGGPSRAGLLAQLSVMHPFQRTVHE